MYHALPALVRLVAVVINPLLRCGARCSDHQLHKMAHRHIGTYPPQPTLMHAAKPSAPPKRTYRVSTQLNQRPRPAVKREIAQQANQAQGYNAGHVLAGISTSTDVRRAQGLSGAGWRAVLGLARDLEIAYVLPMMGKPPHQSEAVRSRLYD